MRYQFFTERKGEKAHRDAVAMGLQYKGFGYWADPQTGEAKYKTVNDQLVPVEPDVESDMYKGDDAEGGPAAAAPRGQMAVPGGMAAGAAGAPPVGTGLNIGPAAAQAAAPAQKKGWDAGPDGDTCIDGQPKDEVPQDTFVGKTNNMKWTAGPDGSTAIELGEMRRMIEDVGTEIADILFNNKTPERTKTFDKVQRKQDKQKAIRDVAADIKSKNPVARDLSQAKRIAKRVRLGSLGRKVGGPDDSMLTRALAHNIAGEPEGERTRQLHQMISRQGGNVNLEDPKQFLQKSAMDRLMRMSDGGDGGSDQMKVARAGQLQKDKDIVADMNQKIRDGGYFSDPDFDLDDVGEQIGEGQFGNVFLSPDGKNVIKEGGIGVDELLALKKLRDNPSFPTLLNAKFTEPFGPHSHFDNNPLAGDQGRKTQWLDRSAYWNPDDRDDMDDFDERFPTAAGRYAMSLAEGKPLDDMWSTLDGEGKLGDTLRQILLLRRDMHKQGIAHQDMHGKNIFVNNEGRPSVIDLGLSKDDPLAALMEGLGALSGRDGQFNMGAAPWMDTVKEFYDEDTLDALQEGTDDIRQMFMDQLDDTYGDDDEERFSLMDDLEQVLKGGIRQNKADVDLIKDQFPFLGDRDTVMQMIDMLYSRLDDPAAERMARAADKLTNTARDVAGGRKLRPGERLVPHRNLIDFDD